jgi:hypothetical protein
MKRFALGLLFALWSSLAFAQGCGPSNPNCIVSTAPVNSNNNQAASTAYADRAATSSTGGVTISGPAAAGYVPIATGATGAVWAPVFAGAILADIQPGSDMGAKINAAIALLPAGGGIVDARGLTGFQTLSTAVTIPANSQLLLGPAVITQSAMISVGQVSSLICLPSGAGQGNNFGQTRFFQANGANLAAQIKITGGQATVQNCIADGNKTNNGSAGPILLINNSHYYVAGMTLQNGASHGVEVLSTLSNNEAGVGQINNVTSIANNGDGLYCTLTGDTFIELSSFENNAGPAGVELNDCPGTRLSNYDIGGNQIGLSIYGPPFSGGVSVGSNAIVIGIGQFGNQTKQDILIDGSLGGAFGNSVVGAIFIGSSFRTSNTFAAIDLHDSAAGGNILSGLQITSTGGHTNSNAIFIHGTEGPDVVGPIVTQGTFGGATFNVLASTMLTSACDNNSGICLNQSQQFPFYLPFANNGTAIATNSTSYFGPSGNLASLQSWGWVTPGACVMQKIVFQTDNNPAVSGATVTLYDDAGATSMTGTYASGAFGTTLTGSVSVAANHSLNVQFINPAGANTTNVRGFLLGQCRGLD